MLCKALFLHGSCAWSWHDTAIGANWSGGHDAPMVGIGARMPLTRSQQMARIHGTNTQPEILLQSALAEAGFVPAEHPMPLAGRPDIVLERERIAIFIDGCFWHGCPDHYVRPRTRTEFWSSKLRSNVERDQRQTLELEAAGWRVLRFWEHEVFEAVGAAVDRIRRATLAPPVDDDPAWRVVVVVPVGGDDREVRTMQALRNPDLEFQVEQPRSTRKWSRTRA